MKKLLALVVAALMIMTMAIPAMAAVTMDTSIAVNGLMAGDQYKLYQVLTWDQSAGAWKLAPGFTGLQLNGKTAEADVVKEITDGITQAEANVIAAQIATGSPAVKASGTIATGSTSFSYAIDSATDTSTLGLYMAIITAGTPEYVYNPMFLAADFETNTTSAINATSAYTSGLAKRQQITLTKTTSDSNQTLEEAIDSYVGEEVTFDVNTTIPVFLDSYKNPSFVIYDNIETVGIDLDADSIEITLGTTTYAKTASGAKLAYDDDIFTVSATGGNQGSYTITFDKDWLDANTTAVPVHVQYKGTITNTAEFNLNEDNNTVTVTYSNGPENEKGAMRDRTNHYTFSIGAKAFGGGDDAGKTYELVKVAVDENGKPVVEKRLVSEWNTSVERHPLAGATFGLYTDSSCTTPYTNDLYPSGATFVTGADGVITFKGLAAGDYYLQEISAPGGYIADSRIVHVNIAATYESVTVPDAEESGIKVKGYTVDVLKSYTVTVNNVSVYDSTDEEYEAATDAVVTTYEFDNDGLHTSSMTTTSTNDSDLINTQGVALPSTGGVGTTIFYVAGMMMVLGAGTILVARRKADEE